MDGKRQKLSKRLDNSLFRLDGGIGAKARRATIETLRQRCHSDTPFALFATASLLGEGFDMPRLDTLFLTMPISFPGRIIQYAGRLHRRCADKQNVVIHDYVELGSALANTMYRRRLPAYRKLGYEICSDLEPEALIKVPVETETGPRGAKNSKQNELI
jgi:superfamily II DNA or RNA helicase